MNLKQLSIVLRVLLAIAGIIFICWAVNWSDRVQLTAGTHLPDGRVLTEDQSFRAQQIADTQLDKPATFELEIPTDDGSLLPMVVSVESDQATFQAGILTTLKQADRNWLLLGCLVVGGVYPLMSFRWWMLMYCRGLAVTPRKAFKLVMVGCFFNYSMPGTTGGDVLKAYYAAKRSDRRAAAVISVVVDRIAGLLGLVVLAGTAGLLMFENPLARSVSQTVGVGVLVGSLMAGAYFSPKWRHRLGVEAIRRRLPGQQLLGSIDQAMVAYGNHRVALAVALLLSVIIHLLTCFSAACAGYALGLDKPLVLLMVVMPTTFLVGVLPLAPQGIGVMEAVAMAMLLDPPAATANQILGMLLLARLFQVIYSMFGSVFLLKGDIHLHPPADTAG